MRVWRVYNNILVGGPNLIVEIDEILLVRRINNAGRICCTTPVPNGCVSAVIVVKLKLNVSYYDWCAANRWTLISLDRVPLFFFFWKLTFIHRDKNDFQHYRVNRRRDFVDPRLGRNVEKPCGIRSNEATENAEKHMEINCSLECCTAARFTRRSITPNDNDPFTYNNSKSLRFRLRERHFVVSVCFTDNIEKSNFCVQIFGVDKWEYLSAIYMVFIHLFFVYNTVYVVVFKKSIRKNLIKFLILCSIIYIYILNEMRYEKKKMNKN